MVCLFVFFHDGEFLLGGRGLLVLSLGLVYGGLGCVYGCADLLWCTDDELDVLYECWCWPYARAIESFYEICSRADRVWYQPVPERDEAIVRSAGQASKRCWDGVFGGE